MDASGLVTPPSTPVLLTTPFPYTGPSGGPAIFRPAGDRISMDCFDLKKVVFAWEESSYGFTPSSGIPVLVTEGGIKTRSIEITTSGAPFIPDLKGTKKVMDTDFWGSLPDVAFAENGNRVRIAYINSDTLLIGAKNIIIRNRDFASINTIPAATLSFTVDDSIVAATTMYGSPNQDHVNLDCPDHFGGDLWSIVYNAAPTVLYAHTKPLSGGIPVNTMINGFLPGINRNPVVAYSDNPPANGINYGWYNQVEGSFLSTTLDAGGSSFSTATPAGTYRKIDTYIPGSSWYEPRLAFNRQNDRNGRFKIAYPMMVITTGSWCDMRSKLIPWGSPAFRPLGTEDAIVTDFEVQAFPNPFEESIKIMIKNDNGVTRYDVAITDVQGRNILQTSGTLAEVNTRLSTIDNLAAGSYFLSFKSQDGKVTRDIKLVRN